MCNSAKSAKQLQGGDDIGQCLVRSGGVKRDAKVSAERGKLVVGWRLGLR
jgi:hypothetical protein